ncbi:MAG: PQQ-binding-like beta-propeller repeat protein [Euryarchaeota archaeon]|nr:PQQ-binding-like beta-propeller repeat protein [Euryarchaeota archaeon]
MKKGIAIIFLISLVMGCIQEQTKILPQGLELPKGVEFIESYEMERKSRGSSLVAVSEDDFITILEKNRIHVFDRTEGKKILEYTCRGRITHFVFSSDKEYLAISTANPNNILLLNKKGKKFWEYRLDDDEEYQVKEINISGDGSLVVVGLGAIESYRTRIYFIKNGKLIKSYTYPELETYLGVISTNYDGSYTVVGTGYLYSKITLFDKNGEILWEHKWKRRSKALFSNVTKAFISDDGTFGTAIYDDNCGACFFNEKGVFYDHEADPCSFIVSSCLNEKEVVLLNGDGRLSYIDKGGIKKEYIIWGDRVGHGLYDAEILKNGEYILAQRYDNKNLIVLFTREGVLLWKKEIKEVIGFCALNNKVVLYEDAFEGNVSILNQKGQVIWSWSLKDSTDIIGVSLFDSRTPQSYKVCYSEEDSVFLTTKLIEENKVKLFFFKIDLEALQ